MPQAVADHNYTSHTHAQHTNARKSSKCNFNCTKHNTSDANAHCTHSITGHRPRAFYLARCTHCVRARIVVTLFARCHSLISLFSHFILIGLDMRGISGAMCVCEYTCFRQLILISLSRVASPTMVSRE